MLQVGENTEHICLYESVLMRRKVCIDVDRIIFEFSTVTMSDTVNENVSI